jgi:molybdopterin-guanine dinucleotide biosynthesis protein MobB
MERRIHIVGRKNSGKTTLVVDLVNELSSRGLRIGTIKHTHHHHHHHHEFDTPGKDSNLHRQAGALVVGLVGPAMAAAYREHSESDRTVAIDKLEPLFSDCDQVLVEGQQQANAVKLEVWRERLASRLSPWNCLGSWQS